MSWTRNGAYRRHKPALVLIVGQETEIDTGNEMYGLTFTANGEYLLSVEVDVVRVWRVKDGERVAILPVRRVGYVTVSRDGRWIAAASWDGAVSVWKATTYEQVFVGKAGGLAIFEVDFSPASSRLVSAGGNDDAATIWDIAACQKVRTLEHDEWVGAAQYSPQGERVATATETSVRVWDSNDGRLLVNIHVPKVDLWRGLLWFNNHLFVKTEGSRIKEINASTSSTVSEWSVPPTNHPSYIILPQHGQFMAYASRETITFWSTSTPHAQLGLISHSRDKCSIAFCPDGQLLVIVGIRKIIIRNLSSISVRYVSCLP